MQLDICTFCGSAPQVVDLPVFYRTARKQGAHAMYRVECGCGAHGKCRPTAETAAEAWNEPWQALPLTAVLLRDARKAMQNFVDKCDDGKARSKRSYAEFSAVLTRLRQREENQQ